MMKSGFYTTNGSDQLSGWTGLRRSSKALPKVKHAPKKKKVLVTVWWSAAHLIHYSFLNPGETITCEKYSQQIEGMHRKLKPTLANRMGPILRNT